MNVFPSTLGDLYIGSIHDGLQNHIDSHGASLVYLIADDHTADLCVPLLGSIVSKAHCSIIPSGEANKSIESCQQIWSQLVKAGADRSSLILNVGGGMVCDLGGFAASCYQRGIRFGHIPTSLLAMADAAIGGKTGVNFGGFKNYIGRFEKPSFIWIDPVFLNTLPPREMVDGMAEIVKHAIIGSSDLWNMLNRVEHISGIDWMNILKTNTTIKQHITEADPLEKGIRKTLNFGHTIGHALESHFMNTDHPMSHGQAVTLGMLAESKLANLTGLMGNEDFERIIGLIGQLLSPSEVTLPSFEELQYWLAGDKKKSMGRIGYSLPDRIGSCGWDIYVKENEVADSLHWLGTYART